MDSGQNTFKIRILQRKGEKGELRNYLRFHQVNCVQKYEIWFVIVENRIFVLIQVKEGKSYFSYLTTEQKDKIEDKSTTTRYIFLSPDGQQFHLQPPPVPSCYYLHPPARLNTFLVSFMS